MDAIFGMAEALLDALFPPRESELLLRSTSKEVFERLLGPIARDGAEALIPYDHPNVQALVWELKYYGSEKAVTVAADLLANHIRGLLAEEVLDPPVLVAIPLHLKRFRERGYNQSERLAHAAARKLGARVAYAPNLLVKTGTTPRQTQLPRHKRLSNMRGVFQVSRAPAIAGRTCILIDDVLTTGATLSEAAKTLRHAGASRVFPVAIAYAQ